MWKENLHPWSVLVGCDYGELVAKLFSLGLEELPTHTAVVLIDPGAPAVSRDRRLDSLMRTLKHAWAGTVLAIIHGLWVWRIGLVVGDDAGAASLRIKAVKRVRQRVNSLVTTYRYSDDPVDPTAERTVLLNLLKTWSLGSQPTVDAVLLGSAHYVCFFDGGSSGSPGPGGAGSVLVAVDRTTRAAKVVWFACMTYGDRKTTNNIAENRGLVHGLTTANKSRLRPLYVVGDSSLIINQVRHHKRPKAQHLVSLHTKATRLAADIGVSSWRHHLGAYNKMADAAVNIAMDDASSLQSAASGARPELHL